MKVLAKTMLRPPLQTALAVALVLATLAGMFVRPATAQEVGDAERKRIEAVVRDYLTKNPDVIIDALRAYEEKRQASAQQEATAALVANRAAIELDPRAPVAGNPKGDVTIVEFFDYRCGYCKKVTPVVREILKKDGNIRFVFKEFPILGPDSRTAAQAAQAAWMIQPDKYLAFHVALMENRGNLDEARVLEIAKSVGIDPGKLKTAMADPAVSAKLSDNLELAQKLQIGGTPAFIVDDQIMPGAVDLETLVAAVAAARKS
ncbi:MAG: DsbA family protein [Rhodospirillales bacterium]